MSTRERFSAILIFVFAFTVFGYAQQKLASGVIQFVDGTEVQFVDVLGTLTYYEEGGQLIGGNLFKTFPVYYQNSWRNIPWSDIKSFEVLSSSFGERKLSSSKLASKIPGMFDVKVRIETKTENAIEFDLVALNFIIVQLKDDLTGELTRQNIMFYKDSGLNIARILLN